MSSATKFSEGWSLPLLTASSWLAEPLTEACRYCAFRLRSPIDPKKFENCANRVHEIGVRALIVAGIAIGALTCYAMPVPSLLTVVTLGVGSKILRAVGYSLQTEGFTYTQGTAAEVSLDENPLQFKVFSLNLCGIGGGLTLNHGGVVHWKYRLDSIIKKILQSQANVVILQEVYDGRLAAALNRRLSPFYHNQYTHLGPNGASTILGSEGGLALYSNLPVHHLSTIAFENNDCWLNRGFAVMEVKADRNDQQPMARIIGTHLIHNSAPNRASQVAQIVAHIAKQRLNIPTFLAGDLNIERGSAEDREVLSPHFRHGYTSDLPTATNELVKQWDPNGQGTPAETIDYFSLYRQEAQPRIDCELIPSWDATLKNSFLKEGDSPLRLRAAPLGAASEIYSSANPPLKGPDCASSCPFNTKTADSDHQAILATVTLAPQEQG